MSTAQVFVASGVLGLSCFAAVASPQIGEKRTVQYLCGQTSHFRMDDGAGGTVPFVSSSSFIVDVEFEYGGPVQFGRRKGYEYYKARSDMNAAGAHNNPLFQGNGNSGENPLFGSPTMVVRPVDNPLIAEGREPGFYVGWSDATGHFDLWDGMVMRVQFFDAAGVMSASYVAEDGLTMVSDRIGSSFALGEEQTFSFKTGGAVGPVKWMAPESIRRGSTDPALPGLWLEEITFTTVVIPTPGVGVLAGAGLVMAGRRRR
jgi:hypothetical protein